MDDKMYRLVVNTVSGKRYVSRRDIKDREKHSMLLTLDGEGFKEQKILIVDTPDGIYYVNPQQVESFTFIDY